MPNAPHSPPLVRAGGPAPRRACWKAAGKRWGRAVRAGLAWRECGIRTRLAPRRRTRARCRRRQWLERAANHLVGWFDRTIRRRAAKSSPPLPLSGHRRRTGAVPASGDGRRQPWVQRRRPAPRHATSPPSSPAWRGVASGLATGIDAAAHEAALAVGGLASPCSAPATTSPIRRASTAAGAHRRGRRGGQRIPARHPRRGAASSRRATASSAASRWHAGGRGRAEIRRADHRQAGGDRRARGLRPARLDRQPDERLPPADPRRRAAGRVAGRDPVRAAAARDRPGMALERRLACCEGPDPGREADGALEPGIARGRPHGLWQALGHDPTDMDQLVCAPD